jgi:hypothetical protein
MRGRCTVEGKAGSWMNKEDDREITFSVRMRTDPDSVVVRAPFFNTSTQHLLHPRHTQEAEWWWSIYSTEEKKRVFHTTARHTGWPNDTLTIMHRPSLLRLPVELLEPSVLHNLHLFVLFPSFSTRYAVVSCIKRFSYRDL